uniref:Uncharacterized protein n=1 Tax=Anguilla anguilla TaxID=7936 RepID=A0A0E9WJX9_ANGAN
MTHTHTPAQNHESGLDINYDYIQGSIAIYRQYFYLREVEIYQHTYDSLEGLLPETISTNFLNVECCVQKMLNKLQSKTR